MGPWPLNKLQKGARHALLLNLTKHIKATRDKTDFFPPLISNFTISSSLDAITVIN